MTGMRWIGTLTHRIRSNHEGMHRYMSTTKAAYTKLTQWMDKNLLESFQLLPANIQAQTNFDNFPIPHRLSHTPRKQTPTTSTPTAYVNFLAKKVNLTAKVTTVQHSMISEAKNVQKPGTGFGQKKQLVARAANQKFDLQLQTG
jgi:hypothetical protein